MEAAMSDATLQAVHDAIAAHIADDNQGAAEFLTEWVLVASCAIASSASQETYYVYSTDSPIHHTLGLLHYGKAQIDAEVISD